MAGARGARLGWQTRRLQSLTGRPGRTPVAFVFFSG